MSFTEKKITAVFTLSEQGVKVPAKANTFKSGGNQLTLEGLRMIASFESYGITSQGNFNLRIWGMDPEDMNRLNTLSIRTGTGWNGIALLAGDDLKGMTQVYSGTICDAYTDYSGLPDVAFCVDSQAGWYEKMVPAAANSFPGTVGVDVILKSLAGAVGFAFINHGVTVQLTNHYLCGTIMNQIQDVVQSTGIGCRLANDTLEIFPSGGFTDEESVVLDAETGMIGYPEFDPYGLAVTSVFNPDLIYGRRVTVRSSIPQACGDFWISGCAHNISSNIPGGPWFTSLRVWNNDVPRTY